MARFFGNHAQTLKREHTHMTHMNITHLIHQYCTLTAFLHPHSPWPAAPPPTPGRGTAVATRPPVMLSSVSGKHRLWIVNTLFRAPISLSSTPGLTTVLRYDDPPALLLPPLGAVYEHAGAEGLWLRGLGGGERAHDGGEDLLGLELEESGAGRKGREGARCEEYGA